MGGPLSVVSGGLCGVGVALADWQAFVAIGLIHQSRSPGTAGSLFAPLFAVAVVPFL